MILNFSVFVSNAQIITPTDTVGSILISPNGIFDNSQLNNVGLGAYALRSITTGQNNVGIGKFSLYTNTTGN